MKSLLTLQLRPRKLADLVGQDHAVELIRRQAKSSRLPFAWLLHGPAGSGKTSLARILAFSYQFVDVLTAEKFGDPPLRAWKEYSDYAITEINASSLNGVEAVRELTGRSGYLPSPPSRCLVYILDEAQRLTKPAQEALLKPTEEGPAVWIFCTTDPGQFLRTLKNRCYPVEMLPLAGRSLAILLKRAAAASKFSGTIEPLQKALAEAEIHSGRSIILAAERYYAGASPREAVGSLGGEGALDTLAICRAVVHGDWRTIRAEIDGASAADMRGIRLSVLGYLRSTLLRSDSPGKAVKAIEILAAPLPYEDVAAAASIASSLYFGSRFYA